MSDLLEVAVAAHGGLGRWNGVIPEGAGRCQGLF
jgi:hypothetical protein